jgi:uncharacterized coiled-coil protein SlyX
METRLENLELKLMDMEISVEQLNNVILQQQQTIERLTLKIERCEQLLQASESPIASAAEEVPPPHY